MDQRNVLPQSSRMILSPVRSFECPVPPTPPPTIVHGWDETGRPVHSSSSKWKSSDGESDVERILPRMENNTQKCQGPPTVTVDPDKSDADFLVNDNPFAFSAGQLSRLINPKGLFHSLGGLRGIDRRGDGLDGVHNPRKDDAHFSNLKDYGVKARVGQHQVFALADTGAQSNFISTEFAEKIGLVPGNQNSKRIRLPGGKQLLSPGTVKVPFSFFGEVKKYLLDCLIIPGCTSDLILSGTFLRATKTLTTFKNRIEAFVRQSPRNRLRLNLLGNERQRLWGSVNRRLTLALPDTGSDVMLVSTEWAKENELRIDRRSQNRLELELADGSTIFTTGVVRNATWTFGDSAQSASCDLYVLNNLFVDVVLSNDFIFKHDVFSKFDDFMIALNPRPDLSEFYNVRLISKFSDKLTRLEEESMNDMSSPYARKAERVRRDQIRDEINTFDEARQNEAWEAERRRQWNWDRKHEQHKRNAGLADTGQSPPKVDSQDSFSPKHRWWKKATLWTRVNGGPKGKPDLEGAKIPSA